MKHILFLISFALCYVPTHSQGNFSTPSMLEGNPVWEYCVNEGGTRVNFDFYYLKGDTLRNGIRYRKAYNRRITYSGWIMPEKYVCGIRQFEGNILINREDFEKRYDNFREEVQEEGGFKVLDTQFPAYGEYDEVLMDLSASDSDTIIRTPFTPEEDSVTCVLVIDSIRESVLDSGEEVRLFHVLYTTAFTDNDGKLVVSRPFDEQPFAFWVQPFEFIEGIGYKNRFVPAEQYVYPTQIMVYHLNRFWRDGELIYQVRDYDPSVDKYGGRDPENDDERAYFKMISPTFKDNPYLDLFLSTTAVHDVINKAQEHEAIFDLQGRQLRHRPEKGLYIQNGKKMMAR